MLCFIPKCHNRELRQSGFQVAFLTQLHAWWHLCAGLATYLHIVLSSLMRMNVLGYKTEVKVSSPMQIACHWLRNTHQVFTLLTTHHNFSAVLLYVSKLVFTMTLSVLYLTKTFAIKTLHCCNVLCYVKCSTSLLTFQYVLHIQLCSIQVSRNSCDNAFGCLIEQGVCELNYYKVSSLAYLVGNYQLNMPKAVLMKAFCMSLVALCLRRYICSNALPCATTYFFTFTIYHT